MGDLYQTPETPIQMKVFQGGGKHHSIGGGGGAPMSGGGSDMYTTPSQPIEMKVFQGGGEHHALEGGGIAEANQFRRNIEAFKETAYYKAISAKPFLKSGVTAKGGNYTAGLCAISEQGGIALFQRAGDKAGAVGPATGHIDPPDDLSQLKPAPTVPIPPGMVAAIRETQEETGIDVLIPGQISKSLNTVAKQLQTKKDNFILFYSNPGMEFYFTVESKQGFSKSFRGPMREFAGEVNTKYDFREFKKGSEVSEIRQGVAFVGLEHALTVLEANENLDTQKFTRRLLKILVCILKHGQEGRKSLDEEIKTTLGGEYDKMVPKRKGPPPPPPRKKVGFAEGWGGEEGGKGGDEGGEKGKGEEEDKGKGREGGEEDEEDKGKGGEGGEGANEKPIPKKERYEAPCPKGQLLLIDGIYRVPCVPDDDSEKERIQALDFKGDEELIFKNLLHFDHPYIRIYLQEEEVKEDWYEFWRLYVNFDGSNKFNLLTYQEGRFIQSFMKKVWKAYQKYLLNGALTYLLKSKSPIQLYEYLNPPKKTTGFLFETIERVPTAKEEEEEKGPEENDEDENYVPEAEEEGDHELPDDFVLSEEELSKDERDTSVPRAAPAGVDLAADVEEPEEESGAPSEITPSFLDNLSLRTDKTIEEKREILFNKIKTKMNARETGQGWNGDIYQAIRPLRFRWRTAAEMRKFMKELLGLPPGSNKLFAKKVKSSDRRYYLDVVYREVAWGTNVTNLNELIEYLFNTNVSQIIGTPEFYKIVRIWSHFYQGLKAQQDIIEFVAGRKLTAKELEEHSFFLPEVAAGGGEKKSQGTRSKRRTTRSKQLKKPRRVSKKASKRKSSS